MGWKCGFQLRLQFFIFIIKSHYTRRHEQIQGPYNIVCEPILVCWCKCYRSMLQLYTSCSEVGWHQLSLQTSTPHKVIFEIMRIKPIQYSELVENIYDWKAFIRPHISSSKSLEFTRVSEPHHFQFYQGNNCPLVQHKSMQMMHGDHPLERFHLHTLPNMRSKHGFDAVFQSHLEEIVVWQSFVSLKERQLEQLSWVECKGGGASIVSKHHSKHTVLHCILGRISIYG